jgi:hypothetical protein
MCAQTEAAPAEAQAHALIVPANQDDTHFSAQEQHRFAELERIIGSGFRTFASVGQALAEVRDDELYGIAGFPTFEDYCKTRWRISRSRAYQLVNAAQAIKNLSTIVDKPEAGTIVSAPTHESQIRPLAGLDPHQQREAWTMALESSPEPTAADVERAVRVVVGEKIREQGGDRPQKEKTKAPERPAKAAVQQQDENQIVEESSSAGTSRCFAALLRDIRANPTLYDPEAFLEDRELVALYREVQKTFLDFLKHFHLGTKK